MLLKSDKRVLFMHKDITKEQVLKLDGIFQELYPDLTYGIVLLAKMAAIKMTGDCRELDRLILSLSA